MSETSTKTLIDWKTRCQDCDAVFEMDEALYRCLKCEGPLQLDCDYEQLSQMINITDWKQSSLRSSKYWEALPLPDLKNVVTLHEGVTPLKKFNKLGQQLKLSSLYGKAEHYNPTGVFKDRGSLLEISYAAQKGYKTVVCASTGNMAASVSAYSAKAGLECFIFVPEGTPVGKLAQIMAYGAKLIAVRGTYNDCVALTEFLAKEYNYFLVGDYVLRAEGHKTMAFEMVEQLHWQVPDWVVVPMGNGTNIAGIHKGFVDLHALGLIDRIPRFVGVQPAINDSIVKAWEQNVDEPVATGQPVYTLASATNVLYPIDCTKALHVIRSTEGQAVSITEEEIVQAQMELSREESIFVEPSSALPYAAVKKLVAKSVIREDDTTVLVLTGHGLKDPNSIITQQLEPPVVEPSEDALKQLWDEKIYELGKVSAEQAREVAWEDSTVPEDLSDRITEWFGVRLQDGHMNILKTAIEAFHKKMPVMSMHSLNLLLEDITKLPNTYQPILKVQDFGVTIPLKGQPESRVVVALNGDTFESQGSGVGPVDGVINAIADALSKSQHAVAYRLIDYDVNIDKGGTDAIVRVHMILENEKGVQYRGSAVSPDVVTASIVAFERAYNLLYVGSKD